MIPVKEEKMTSPEVEAEVDLEHAKKFYTRLRRRIDGWFERRGKVGDRIGEVLLLLPDFFALVLRLMRDPRIAGRTKLELAAVTAYVLSPIDLIPDFLFPIGFADDALALALVVGRVAKLMGDAGEAILEEHWEGEVSVLQAITKVTNAVDALLNKRIVRQLRRRFGGGEESPGSGRGEGA
jgi:uncharacterized membrane protein YkvA (DUF1232 family)